MIRWSRICLLLFCMAQGAGLSGAVVQAARLNVRVAPAPDAPIVASLSAGTRVDIVPENEHWAEIAAPEGVPVWVASLFVAADGSLRKGARLRCGPGTVFAEYRIGTLPPEPVSVMEKSHDGFWLRIRPVPGLKCFISRRFLKEEAKMKKQERLEFRDGRATGTEKLAEYIAEKAGVETRTVIPGHLQRGGSPSPYDRLLSTEMGSYAGRLAKEGKHGVTVALRGTEITYNALADIAGKMKFVPTDHQLLGVARSIGISFGDGR